MKKLMLLIALLACNFMLATAQEDIVLYIEDRPDNLNLCIDDHQRVIIYAQEGCEEFQWFIDGIEHYENPIIVDWQHGSRRDIDYWGLCDGFSWGFIIFYHDNRVPSSFTHDVWKRQGSVETIEAVGIDSTGSAFSYNFLWSTGSTERTIDVSEPGTYTCEITHWCGTATRTFNVRDNVELFRATTNLTSNCNQATWQTTPEQAEYVQEVNVYRNNQLVATVPYTDGVFTDNIGSADAPWQYHLVAVSNGEECPLRSYWARTISMSDLMGSQGTQTLTWTSYEQENPAKGDEVQAYGIFDVVGGNPRLVIEVGSFVNMYNYDPSNFDGYAAVAAIFSRDGKSPLDFEDCAFSNRTEAPLGLGEHEAATFSVYPNPSSGVFTVEGAGMLTVTNVLGQTIKETEIDGQYIMELPQGVYFITVGSTTRKVVVE